MAAFWGTSMFVDEERWTMDNLCEELGCPPELQAQPECCTPGCC